jgi:acetoacetyl-CoA reductase
MPKVALVTGGTRGIGEVIAIELKEAGYLTVANYGGNDERASEFRERTGISTYKFDVSDFDACKNGIELIEREVGPVSILVNNAGITRDGTLHKMYQPSW